MNDVFSNSAAIIAGTIASKVSVVWWIDPAAGIAISAVIIVRWIGVVWDQVKKVTSNIISELNPPQILPKEAFVREEETGIFKKAVETVESSMECSSAARERVSETATSL